MPDAAAAKPLTYEVERDGDTAVVKCHGRLVWGQTDALYHEVKELLPQIKELVLDLEGVGFVDSSGLGVLVCIYVSARNASCRIKMLHLARQLRNLLSMTNLSSVLDDAGSDNTPVA